MLPTDRGTCLWIFIFINVLISSLRDWHLLSTFPYYKTKALVCQAYLQVTLSSLNFAFAAVTVCSYRGSTSIDSVVILWVILIIIAGKVAVNLVNRSILSLLTGSEAAHPEFMIQKIFILKELRKRNKLPDQFSSRYDWIYLLNTTIAQDLGTMFNIDQNHPLIIKSDMTDKKDMNRLFIAYLEALARRFPKSDHIKLLIAYFYARKLKCYGSSLRALNELQKNQHSKNTILNTLSLINDIERSTEAYYNSDSGINIGQYIRNLEAMSYLKINMMEQAKTQITLYQEMLKSSPDLIEISKHTHKILKSKECIKQDIKKMLETISDTSYLEPYLVCANYHLIVNHSRYEHMRFIKMFSDKKNKYQQYFKCNELLNKNLYQEQNLIFFHLGTEGKPWNYYIYFSKYG